MLIRPGAIDDFEATDDFNLFGGDRRLKLAINFVLNRLAPK